ncbi:MAG: hypothetical protein GC190_20145 [Alphaproteobacteria bacterium]|nr:hypothetical protein [Alphaproteobacteria bacterium]
MKFATAIFLILGLTGSAFGGSSDWKFYGGATVAGGEPEYLFYDAAGLQHVGTHVKVWVKGLPSKELEKARDAADQGLIDRAAKKLAHYYVPPIARLRNIDQDQAIDIILFEEIADDATIEPRSRILYEIDCPGKMIRDLSVWLVGQHGRPGTRDTPGEWKHIPPETNGAALSTLLCPLT